MVSLSVFDLHLSLSMKMMCCAAAWDCMDTMPLMMLLQKSGQLQLRGHSYCCYQYTVCQTTILADVLAEPLQRIHIGLTHQHNQADCGLWATTCNITWTDISHIGFSPAQDPGDAFHDEDQQSSTSSFSTSDKLGDQVSSAAATTLLASWACTSLLKRWEHMCTPDGSMSRQRLLSLGKNCSCLTKLTETSGPP